MIKINKNIKVSFLAILQVLFSFACSYFISKILSFGNKLDIYYLSLGMYLFNLSIITNSIQAVIAPNLIKSQDESFKYRSFLNILVIIIVYSLIYLIISKQIIFVLFSNLINQSNFNLIYKLQIVFLLALIFKTINIVGVSILQKKENYVKINFSLVFATCIFFLIIFIFSNSEDFTFLCGVGYLVRNIVEFFLMSYKIISLNKLIKSKVDFKLLKELLANCRIFIFGQLFYKTEDLLDKFISSFLVEGFLSFTSFIKSIFSAFSNVLINSYVIQSLSFFSKNIYKNKDLSLKYMKKRIYILLYISLALIVTNYFLGDYVFNLLFRNKFSLELSKYISITLIISSVIVFSIPLNALYQNYLLGLSLHKKIVFLDSLSYSFSIVLKIILSYKFGVYGFLIAFLLSSLVKNTIKSLAIYKLENKKYA